MFNNCEEMKILLLGGLAGAITRLLLHPEKSWKARFSQLIVGVLCAVFLGGLVANWLNAGPAGLAAAAYVVGSLGEQALAVAQNRFTKPKK